MPHGGGHVSPCSRRPGCRPGQSWLTSSAPIERPLQRQPGDTAGSVWPGMTGAFARWQQADLTGAGP